MRSLGLLVALVAACSDNTAGVGDAGVDLSNNGCPQTQKLCAMMCVDRDPAHGCDALDCNPCGGGANGAAACFSGACGLQCNVGFGDCDANASNGCEKDVTADPANCGSCGFACPGGASCVNGACQLVMPGMGSDQACLTIDASTIYWATANNNPGAVYSIPKAGGTPTQIITGQMSPRGIAVDAASVYFSTVGGGQILKCPLTGCNGAPTILATGQANPFSVAVDATNVYWTNRGNGTVMKCAVGGCAMNPTMVASGQNMPLEITVDATNVYWSNVGDGSVWKAPVAGGAASMLAMTGMMGARGVASDGSYLYFAQSTQGTVQRVPTGGGATLPIASGQNAPWSVTLDGAGVVVWTNSRSAANGGAVVRAPIGGGPAVTRAANQAFPLCVAADATTLYWINAGGNSVQKVAK